MKCMIRDCDNRTPSPGTALEEKVRRLNAALDAARRALDVPR